MQFLLLKIQSKFHLSNNIMQVFVSLFIFIISIVEPRILSIFPKKFKANNKSFELQKVDYVVCPNNDCHEIYRLVIHSHIYVYT